MVAWAIWKRSNASTCRAVDYPSGYQVGLPPPSSIGIVPTIGIDISSLSSVYLIVTITIVMNWSRLPSSWIVGKRWIHTGSWFSCMLNCLSNWIKHLTLHWKALLWIRIGFMRIRFQIRIQEMQISGGSMRIRIRSTDEKDTGTVPQMRMPFLPAHQTAPGSPWWCFGTAWWGTKDISLFLVINSFNVSFWLLYLALTFNLSSKKVQYRSSRKNIVITAF